MGHTAQQYHYHAQLLSCFFSDFPRQSAPAPLSATRWTASQFMAPMAVSMRRAAQSSCSEQLSAGGRPNDQRLGCFEYVAQSGAQYLDARRNGRIEPDGSYGYHVTSTFPYVLGCYPGVVSFATFNRQAFNRNTIFSWQDFVANGYRMGVPAGGDVSMSNAPARQPAARWRKPAPAGEIRRPLAILRKRVTRRPLEVTRRLLLATLLPWRQPATTASPRHQGHPRSRRLRGWIWLDSGL
ncbi:MAG: hypothetical protein U0694_16615 [Anaerolineae bacterium]